MPGALEAAYLIYMLCKARLRPGRKSMDRIIVSVVKTEVIRELTPDYQLIEEYFLNPCGILPCPTAHITASWPSVF